MGVRRASLGARSAARSIPEGEIDGRGAGGKDAPSRVAPQRALRASRTARTPRDPPADAP